jgi:RHS repeat-associated protein
MENLTSISQYQVAQMDGVGNRTQVTVDNPLLPDLSASSRTYSYNSTNTLLQYAGNESFTYDNMGNMYTRTGGAYPATYTYGFGLTRLTGINAPSYQFTYDGAGNRLKAIRNGVTTYYAYDAAGNLLAEADETKTIKRYYTWGNGLISLYTVNDPILGTKAFTYHFSPNGSTLALTDDTGAMKNRYAYTVFGELTQEEAIPQPFKYVGQYSVMAEPNNLYCMRARYYDATLGRFLQQDPLGIGGGDINLYAYVGNNPVMGIDPWGLCAGNIGLIYDNAGRLVDEQGLVEPLAEPALLLGVGRGASSKFLIAGKEALGIFPTKIGGGGQLKPFSELTGRYVAEASTSASRAYNFVSQPFVSFGVGFAEGLGSGISGADLDLKAPINRAQALGRWAGKMAGSVFGGP